jgi:hypothetical protein
VKLSARDLRKVWQTLRAVLRIFEPSWGFNLIGRKRQGKIVFGESGAARRAQFLAPRGFLAGNGAS